MEKITSIDALKEVLENNRVVLVDLFATWCEPCQQMLPVLEEMAQENTIPFYKIDVDEVPESGPFTGAKVVPAILIYLDGRKREFLFGTNTKDAVEKKIKRVLRLSER